MAGRRSTAPQQKNAQDLNSKKNILMKLMMELPADFIQENQSFMTSKKVGLAATKLFMTGMNLKRLKDAVQVHILMKIKKLNSGKVILYQMLKPVLIKL